MNIINISKADEKDLKLIAISLIKQEKWKQENPNAQPTVLNSPFSKSHSLRYVEAMGRVRSKYGKKYVEVIDMFFKYEIAKEDFNNLGKLK
jgi:hypothetical protein